VRSLYAFVVGALTLVSGGALLLLSRWAVAVFLLCAMVQAAYLVWATRALPPSDAGEAKGRRGSVNTFAPRWWSGSTTPACCASNTYPACAYKRYDAALA
jgi:hypothetical protein